MHTCCHMAFKMLCEVFFLKCNTLHTIPKYIIIQRGAAYPTLPQCKENAWCQYFGQQRAVQLWHLYTQERNRCVCKLKYLVHLNGWTEHMRRKDKRKLQEAFECIPGCLVQGPRWRKAYGPVLAGGQSSQCQRQSWPRWCILIPVWLAHTFQREGPEEGREDVCRTQDHNCGKVFSS